MTCAGPQCSRPVYAHGLCESHRQQQRRGQPLTPLPLPRHCATCSETEFLTDAGECVEQIAARLPRIGNADSLRRHLARHGRDDLAARLQPLADVPRTSYR